MNIKFITIIIIIIFTSGCGNNIDKLNLTSKNIPDVLLVFSSFKEFDVRNSWELKLKNNGKNLNNCSISIDENYSTELQNILIRSGLLGIFKEKKGDNIFRQNENIKISMNSDFDQSEIFINESQKSYPLNTLPTKIMLSCKEGEEIWDLE